MTKDEAKKRVFELKQHAARLWYHGVEEIRLTEDDFAAAFAVGALNAAKDTTKKDAPVEWYFFGLTVVLSHEVSRGN